MVVVTFMSRYMSYVKMAAIAHETFTAASVGPGIFDAEQIPLFVHKYSRTIGSAVYNYKPFLNKMNKAKIIDMLGKPCKQCREGDLGYDDKLGHICTPDLDFVRNEEMRELMSRGTGYRMPEDYDGGDETGTEKDSALGVIMLAVDGWIAKLMKRHEVVEEFFSDFRSRFQENVKRSLDYAEHNVDVHRTAGAVKELPRRAIEGLRKKVIVTYSDKLNGFVFVCPKLYLKWMVDEHFPQGLEYTGTDLTYSIVQRTSDSVVSELCQHQNNAFGIQWKAKRESCDPERKKTPGLASSFLMVKQHKTPMKPRFVEGMNEFALAPLGRLTSSACNPLWSVLKKVWTEEFGNDEVMAHFPVLQSSFDVPDMVEHMNRSIPLTERHIRILQRAYDCTQMYTKIKLDDLKQRLLEIYELAFDYQQRHPVTHTVGPAQTKQRRYIYLLVNERQAQWTWKKPEGGVDTNGKLRDKTHEFDFCITKNILGNWTTYLVENVFIAFGEDLVIKQTIGMPMGTQPAVHWANMYCLAYEFDFFKRARAAGRMDIIKGFRFTARYIDDIIALKNEFIQQYLYNENVDAQGLAGIYPSCLIINREQESAVLLRYCDIEIYKREGNWETTLYSKLDHPPLVGIAHTMYPHHDSFLADQAMYGVVTSHLFRCSRLCSTRGQFIWWGKRVLSALVDKQYVVKKLQGYSKRFLVKHEYLYGAGSWKGLQTDLWADIKQGWRFKPKSMDST